MRKSKKITQFFPYDFDVHHPNTFMYIWTKNYMNATLIAAKQSKYNFSGKTILDIGIGRGRSLTIFKRLGIKKVVGIDINSKETCYAVKQSKLNNIAIDLIIDNKDNAKLSKIDSNSFDVIALMNILFCVPNDKTRKTLAMEAIRILKPGGRLIVLDMQRPSLMWFFSIITGKKWKFRTQKELIMLLKPLELITIKSSNFFYFINKPIDLLSSIIGSQFISLFDTMLSSIGCPPSTKTFIFTKKNG